MSIDKKFGEWDPDSDTDVKRNWLELLSEHVEHPGEWGLASTHSSRSSARWALHALRKRLYKIPEPKKRWTFRLKPEKNANGDFEVWARYREK